MAKAKPKTKTNSGIPEDVQKSVLEAVEKFNHENFSEEDEGIRYVARFKAKQVYLDRSDGDGMPPSPICRLTYTGAADGWKFAIYKYSTERYSSDEMFPGDEELDGTIEGAMRAGMEAY